MIPDFSDLFNKEGIVKCIDFIKSYKNEFLSISLPIILGFEFIILILEATDHFGLGYYPSLLINGALSQVYTVILFLSVLILLNHIESGSAIDIEIIKAFIKERFWYVLLAFLGIMIMTYFGFLMLIIPGIVIAIKLTAAPYLIAIDRFSFPDAIRYSFEGTNNISWAIFIVSFVLSLPVVMVYFIQFQLTSLIGSSLISVFTSLYTVLFYILGFIIYTEVKRRMG